MKYDIIHEGTVADISGDMVVVSISVRSACGDCKVKGLCGMSEETEKQVAVYDRNAAGYRVGETVVVGIGTAMGMKAVLWAYIAPFLLMLATLIATKYSGMTELASGLTTLGAAAVYFVLLGVFRKKLEREITFKINRL